MLCNNRLYRDLRFRSIRRRLHRDVGAPSKQTFQDSLEPFRMRHSRLDRKQPWICTVSSLGWRLSEPKHLRNRLERLRNSPEAWAWAVAAMQKKLSKAFWHAHADMSARDARLG